MSLDIARLRLGDAKFRIDKYIDQHIEEWANEEILQIAQKIAWNRGLSENAIAAMYIEKTGFLAVDLIWDYRGPKDERISKFLEDGTEAHEIYAKGKDFGGADWLSWVDKMGKRVFRKKVNHPGTHPMHIIKDARERGVPALQRRVSREVKKWLELTRID